MNTESVRNKKEKPKGFFMLGVPTHEDHKQELQGCVQGESAAQGRKRVKREDQNQMSEALRQSQASRKEVVVISSSDDSHDDSGPQIESPMRGFDFEN